MNCSLSNVLWYCKSLFRINLHFTMVLKYSVNNRIPSILNFILYARLKLYYIHRRRGKSITVIDDWCQRKHLYQFEFMTSIFILIIPLQNLVYTPKLTWWYLYIWLPNSNHTFIRYIWFKIQTFTKILIQVFFKIYNIYSWRKLLKSLHSFSFQSFIYQKGSYSHIAITTMNVLKLNVLKLYQS